MKRRLLMILLAACLGLTACQGQAQPGTNPSAPAATDQPAPAGNTASELTEGRLDETVSEPAPTVPVPVVPDLPAAEGLTLPATARLNCLLRVIFLLPRLPAAVLRLIIINRPVLINSL